MSIFSEYRAKLYQYALTQPRYDLANFMHWPPHLHALVSQRCGHKNEITYGDVVNSLAPTFEEARALDRLRADVLSFALDMFEEGRTVMRKTSIAAEVVDYMYDLSLIHI